MQCAKFYILEEKNESLYPYTKEEQTCKRLISCSFELLCKSEVSRG